jgi:DNA replication ATP-dependent helicase Dna2
MTLGSLLHELFQTSLANGKHTKCELNSLLVDLLKKRQIISQLYEASLDEEAVTRETSVYLDSIEKWLSEHCSSLAQANKSSAVKARNFRIGDICDIEESIWSPKYGLKGKLDLTVRASIKMSAYKHLVDSTQQRNNQNYKQTEDVHDHVIPVELKSGKTTFSAEHEGQVMLYSLLNHEKRAKSDFGLLLYLKDMQMRFIKVSHVSLRGLVQLRNELTHFISSNRLPEFKNESRVCLRCPLLIPCSLLGQSEEAKRDEMYVSAIGHLTAEHRAYFDKWLKMLEFEFENERQFESGEFVWWKSLSELESLGWTVANLRLAKQSSPHSEVEYSGEGFHLFDFVKDPLYE